MSDHSPSEAAAAEPFAKPPRARRGPGERARLKVGKKLLRLVSARRELPLPERPTTVDSPLEFVAALLLAWEDHDAGALAELFVEDADFVTEVGLWWTSRHSLRRALAWWFEGMYADATFHIERIDERRPARDAAVLTLRWRIEGQRDPEGEATDLRRGIMTVVLAKLPAGGWLATNAQLTDIAMMADTNLSIGGVVTPTSYLRPVEDSRAPTD
jgi:uncharacterized protein (TIGR02246 family)